MSFLLSTNYLRKSELFSKMVCLDSSRLYRSIFTLLLVGTGPKGTYVDTSEIKPPRLKYVSLSFKCFGLTEPIVVDMDNLRTVNPIV